MPGDGEGGEKRNRNMEEESLFVIILLLYLCNFVTDNCLESYSLKHWIKKAFFFRFISHPVIHLLQSHHEESKFALYLS